MTTAPMLETRRLNKRFGGVVAADNIDLSVETGELRCLIGPNGAGKSTLFAMLCGIQRADGGQILLAGRDVTHMQAFQRVRLGVGLTFQTNRAFHQLSVRENLAIPRIPHDAERRALGAERLAVALETFGLDPEDETRAGELSHNQLQWLEIAMVLSGYPDLILLDEPAAGMAGEETARTATLLKRLNATGLTIVVVEHDIAFVKEVAQSVTVLHQGRVFAEGPVEAITANEEVRKIYLGKA
ncbi:branched-chain amino acid transport system ATP-binding protein [Tistlia consotensis]|uniref:Branched-chain amino acid transport system ATP-binding protein n=1 Tax=Tistlia consotensis USBA 355 TaxID=560819 RepID=A0A1Y6CHY4_9PROT|nr:ABC transporter ATP-binding protein [Tistlia consotensis]SMF63853.1 branched-chain amino acid transport system ATP-binding protein [Tistlia consotensis USBA 355]SNR98370.1 branched-chain amino acid transport system ATP-binding protein [Tistlia consotensis]